MRKICFYGNNPKQRWAWNKHSFIVIGTGFFKTSASARMLYKQNNTRCDTGYIGKFTLRILFAGIGFMTFTKSNKQQWFTNIHGLDYHGLWFVASMLGNLVAKLIGNVNIKKYTLNKNIKNQILIVSLSLKYEIH